jgi:hypothetical protein
MSSEALGNKRHARSPDVPNAPDPRPKNASAADEYLGMVEEDVQKDYCAEVESEVDNALEAGGREGQGVTRGQESRMRENSQDHLGPHEMKPFKAGSPAPSHIGGCRKTFPFRVAESPKIGEAWGEVSEPKRTSGGRVKRVATLPASFASGAIPPTCTRNYPLDVISRDVMSSETAAGDKRSALDAPDTDDDDGCAEQCEGAVAAGPKPEQAGTRNKKLRRDGEALNLSQQQREALEHQTVMAIIRQIEEMEYKEQAAKGGAWSTGLEGRVGHGSGKVGEKRRFRDACDTGWGEAAEEGPRGEGGEKLKDKRQKETKRKQEGFQGKGKGEAAEKRKRPLSEGAGTAGKAQRGEGVGGAGAGGGAVKEGRVKCPHNRQRRGCKECGGSSICEHNRKRSSCKECGGASICEHNRQRSNCKDCGGASICEHNRIRSTCKECGGSSICEHNRKRSSCKDCGGASICEHNRQRSQCKPCGGANICEHNRQRRGCKECGGSSICEHNRIRSTCKQCGGASICEHNRERRTCKQCGGASICEHNCRRRSCKDCRQKAD